MKLKTSTCEWMRRWALVLSLIAFFEFWFAAYPIAKSGLSFRDLSEAPTALWIFLILGAIIILLQLVPALIMFFSLIGTGTQAAIDKKKVEEEVEDPLKDEIRF